MIDDLDIDLDATDDAMESIDALQTRAMLALTGNLLGGPLAVKNALVDFLRSEADITPRIRNLLADAIEKGGNRENPKNGFGGAIPTLLVEELGEDGVIGAKILERRRWFEVGEAIYNEIGSIRPKSGELEKAIDRVKRRPGTAVGNESAKKHWAMYKDFLAVKDSHEMLQRIQSIMGREISSAEEPFSIYEYARTIFIEDRANTKDKAWKV